MSPKECLANGNVVLDDAVDLSTIFYQMEPSIVQMSRQRTKDRAKITAALDIDLPKLSISISYDGGLKFDGVITCGISSTDTTQHRLFAFEIDIETECPVEPCSLSVEEVAELAREYMRSKGVDLPSDRYNTFLISPLQKDVAKQGAANAKYRAIVTSPTNEVFSPGTSASDTCSSRRMPHFFFSKAIETKAPMENKKGSGALVNTSHIFDAVKNLKRYLRASYTTKLRPLPDYAALFVYSNVDALDNFVDFIGEIASQDKTLLGEVSGTCHFCSTVNSLELLNVSFTLLNADKLSVKEIASCLSSIFISVSANESVVLPLGVGRLSRFPASTTSASNSVHGPSSSTTAYLGDASPFDLKRSSDDDILSDRDEFNAFATQPADKELATAKYRRLHNDMKECFRCDERNPLPSRFCGKCGFEFI